MRFDTDIPTPGGQGYQATGGFAGRFGAEWKLTDELRLSGYFDLLFSFAKVRLHNYNLQPDRPDIELWASPIISPSIVMGLVVQP